MRRMRSRGGVRAAALVARLGGGSREDGARRGAAEHDDEARGKGATRPSTCALAPPAPCSSSRWSARGRRMDYQEHLKERRSPGGMEMKTTCRGTQPIRAQIWTGRAGLLASSTLVCPPLPLL